MRHTGNETLHHEKSTNLVSRDSGGRHLTTKRTKKQTPNKTNGDKTKRGQNARRRPENKQRQSTNADRPTDWPTDDGPIGRWCWSVELLVCLCDCLCVCVSVCLCVSATVSACRTEWLTNRAKGDRSTHRLTDSLTDSLSHWLTALIAVWFQGSQSFVSVRPSLLSGCLFVCDVCLKLRPSVSICLCLYLSLSPSLSVSICLCLYLWMTHFFPFFSLSAVS